jgi:hypothetical protein
MIIADTKFWVALENNWIMQNERKNFFLLRNQYFFSVFLITLNFGVLFI